MRRIHLAELRDSWAAWAGVSLAFIMVNAALALTVLTSWTGITTGDPAVVAHASSNLAIGGALILLVAVPVLSSSTSLVVNSRRGSLARLALVGASPTQVRSTLVSQLALVSLACAVVGDALAVVLAKPWMALDIYGARNEPLTLPSEPGPHWLPVLVANLGCAAFAVLAGAKQARAASEIPPIEALRQSQNSPQRARLSRGGWALTILGLLTLAGSVGAVVVISSMGDVSVIGHLLMLAAFIVFILTAVLAVLAPILVAPLTRWWTSVVPSRAPSWLMARATVTARADRLYKSVIPIMFTMAIGIGITSVVDSSVASMKASAGFTQLTVPGIADLASLFGLPLALAFSTGVGSLIMMSRQRDAELALVGIVGGTPRQRVWIPFLEALIIAVNATLLSLVVTVPSLVFTWFAVISVRATFVLVLNPVLIATLFVGGVLLTALTTVLPTLPAQRLPEPRVVARLVAE